MATKKSTPRSKPKAEKPEPASAPTGKTISGALEIIALPDEPVKPARGRKASAKKAPTAKLEEQAEARMPTESPETLVADTKRAESDGDAEASAQAADVFEEGFEERVPVEHQEPVTLDIDPPGSPTTRAELPIASGSEPGAGETVAAIETGTEIEPEGQTETHAEEEEETEGTVPRPPAKLERLQKILSKAGVASRRHAEELITGGRVQVNGKIVTELGSKADAGRDHIRVDGKLLQGAERLRYFVLNKPRGYVTTVSDPEGRPTVMEFFARMGERLYPVGRLDYLSEGLLLMTNDGDLANKLTKAANAVEKVYLVKVAGQPTEEELERLRAGVSIDKGKPGEGRVRTSPASVRQVRQGDNPWYEVVLIEGRNRELRKMFEEIGHFVEKIRRVGYGPLVLDLEPGQMRELEAQELMLLRRAAEGKLRPARVGRKEEGRTNLPTVLPKPTRPARDAGARPPYRASEQGEARAREPQGGARTDRPGRGGAGGVKFGSRPAPRFDAPRPAWKKDDRPPRPAGRSAAGGTGEERPARRPYGDRPATSRAFGARPPAGKTYGDKPAGRSFGPRPGGPGPGARPAGSRPTGPRPGGPGGTRPYGAKPATGGGFAAKPTWKKPEGGDWKGEKRTFTPRADSGRGSAPRPFRSESGLSRPFTTSTGKPRAGGARPSSKPTGRSYGAGTGAGRTGPRPGGDARPGFGAKRPYEAKPGGRSSSGPGSRGGASRPFRSEEGSGSSAGRPPRPYTPRPEGAGEFRPRTEGARPERKTGTGWKPKPNFGGAGRPASGDRSRPKTGGFSKPGYKGKSGGSGGSRGSSGPRPGGKRPGPTGGKRP